MADEITKMMEQQRKELVAAGEIGPDEKLNFMEIAKRYAAYQIKKSRENLKGLGLIASEKPSDKSAAQKKQTSEGKPAPKKETRPGETSVAVKIKPAESMRTDSVEAKMQGQYHDSLNKILAPWEKIIEINKQGRGIVIEFLRALNFALAEECSKFQAWVANSIDENAEEQDFLEEAMKRGQAVHKLFEKHLSPSENIQKRMKPLLAELHKRDVEIESLYLEMANRAKEMVSVFEKMAEGEKE
ncbi:MAG: hypothetical protein JW839_06610 [Candidatus Lokiarchaeota archaeon]|nr:hypothetical protein [Candidatus Lokiarchaeota archaeon]